MPHSAIAAYRNNQPAYQVPTRKPKNFAMSPAPPLQPQKGPGATKGNRRNLGGVAHSNRLRIRKGNYVRRILPRLKEPVCIPQTYENSRIVEAQVAIAVALRRRLITNGMNGTRVFLFVGGKREELAVASLESVGDGRRGG